MPREVRAELGSRDRHLAGAVLVESQALREAGRGAPDAPGGAEVLDGDPFEVLDRAQRFHFVTETRVPVPRPVSSSNSSTRRRLPDRPRPSPPAVLFPPASARSTSAIPGPSSTNVARIPVRTPLTTRSSRALPPPPWTRVLRASSLAAVTSFVWSTIESEASIA